jgi:hypothetical protein
MVVAKSGMTMDPSAGRAGFDPVFDVDTNFQLDFLTEPTGFLDLGLDLKKVKVSCCPGIFAFQGASAVPCVRHPSILPDLPDQRQKGKNLNSKVLGRTFVMVQSCHTSDSGSL